MVKEPLVPGGHRVSEHNVVIQTGKGGLVCKSNLGVVTLHFIFRQHMSRSRAARAQDWMGQELVELVTWVSECQVASANRRGR